MNKNVYDKFPAKITIFAMKKFQKNFRALLIVKKIAQDAEVLINNAMKGT